MAKLNKKIHIALILEDLYPDSSGVSRSIQMQIFELMRLGYKVTLLAPKLKTKLKTDYEIIELPSCWFFGLPTHTRILLQNKKIIENICNNYSFDVIHSQTDTGAFGLACKIAKKMNIPHVHTFHTNMAGAHLTAPINSFLGSIGYRAGALKAYLTNRKYELCKLDKKILKKESSIARFDWRSQAMMASSADAFSVPSKYMLKYIKAAGTNSKELSKHIPTGYSRAFRDIIDSKRNSIKDSEKSDKFRIVSVSRLVKEKRLDVVIEAFKKANIKNSELIIIGDGAESASLRQKAKAKNIIFTGHVKEQGEIVDYLLKSDVFILASYLFDNQPIVITEALAAGLPILYCDDRLDVGLNKDNSLLVGPTVDDLAKGMIKLAKTDKLQELREGTKTVFEELSPEKTALSYVDLYFKVLTRKEKFKN